MILDIDRAASLVQQGEIVAHPTETFYGLGVLVENARALEKLFTVKSREPDKPVLFLIGSADALPQWVATITPLQQRLMEEFWPGPLTLLFKGKKGLSPFITSPEGHVAIRISSDPETRLLCQKLGSAMTSTSANPSGLPPASSGEEVESYFGSKISGIVSGKKLGASRGSTILDVTGDEPRLIREGDLSFKTIKLFL